MAYSMLFSAGAMFLSGCTKKLHPGEEKQHAPVKYISIAPAVRTNLNDFSFNLLHRLQTSEDKNANYFISPLSLHMDLGMLLNGASGSNAEQIRNALSLNGQDNEQINQAYKTLLTDLPVADPEVQLGLYNSVWYRNTVTFKKPFIDDMKAYFDATVTAMDFNPQDASRINHWASEKTNGKIKQVIGAINPDDVMFLLNALYFKGDWSSKFDKRFTAKADFHLENGSVKQIQMMRQQKAFKYYADDDLQIITLPYGNGQFEMTVLLPKEGHSVNDLLDGLTATQWADLKEHMQSQLVNIELPRFSIPAYEIKLNNILKAMGMESAFLAGADFSNLTDADVQVSFVKQNTYLRVDEQGTEAAAVTSTGIMTTSFPMPEQMRCDHPFGIVISENTSNTILFMGKIMNPESE